VCEEGERVSAEERGGGDVFDAEAERLAEVEKLEFALSHEPRLGIVRRLVDRHHQWLLSNLLCTNGITFSNNG